MAKNIKEQELLGRLRFLQHITDRNPGLIAVYELKTGKYLYVNSVFSKILGYKPAQLLKGGLKFAASLVHPEDLKRINTENSAVLEKANQKSPPAQSNNEITASFEYRMRHKKGHWVWLQTVGTVFERDIQGQVFSVLNVSYDISDRKKMEQQSSEYYESNIKSSLVREKISTILRNQKSVEDTLHDCLQTMIDILEAKFSRLWLFSETSQLLELSASAGKAPPISSIRSKLKIGEFAVGFVAQSRKPYIVKDIYANKTVLTQNQAWAKKNKVCSFAGYPLLYHNKLIGVITIFSTHELSESVLETLSNVADILAYEIERREIEMQLQQSQHRYESFISQSSEGIWRFEHNTKPISIKLPIKKQLDHFYDHSYLAECNDAMARMYGYKKASDIIGKKLGELLVREDPANTTYLENFINSGYHMTNARSTEIDASGNIRHFENNLVGIIEKGKLIRVWGTQRDITDKLNDERKMQELSQQKDEFIAIASHELKTPLTSLKAYTQILERKLSQNGDPASALMLNKMDAQINKINGLIADLLDVSRIEAGKLQFHFTKFSLNTLLRETYEDMQQTFETQKLVLVLGPDHQITGDRERLTQVLINFISNAVKYSPASKQIIIKSSTQKNNQIQVSVKDFGIGIEKTEQKNIFDRFQRGSNPEIKSFPGLGLGLYICSEIIKRHGGKIGVHSKIGQGSTFYFSLPINEK